MIVPVTIKQMEELIAEAIRPALIGDKQVRLAGMALCNLAAEFCCGMPEEIPITAMKQRRKELLTVIPPAPCG